MAKEQEMQQKAKQVCMGMGFRCDATNYSWIIAFSASQTTTCSVSWPEQVSSLSALLFDKDPLFSIVMDETVVRVTPTNPGLSRFQL